MNRLKVIRLQIEALNLHQSESFESFLLDLYYLKKCILFLLMFYDAHSLSIVRLCNFSNYSFRANGGHSLVKLQYIYIYSLMGGALI